MSDLTQTEDTTLDVLAHNIDQDDAPFADAAAPIKNSLVLAVAAVYSNSWLTTRRSEALAEVARHAMQRFFWCIYSRYVEI